MDIAFLKLRVANDPWLVIDRGGVGASEPDWPTVARLACHRTRGAGASGIVAVERGAARHAVMAWDRLGRACPLAPSAALCAARWLFDAGRTQADAIAMDAAGGASEVIVLDSRHFGLMLGEPSGPDGRRLDPDSARFMSKPREPADGMGAMAVSLRGETLRVRIFDGAAGIGSRRKEKREAVALCVSRTALSVRRGGHDALLAAAAATALASALDCAEPELAVAMGGDAILLQRPEGDAYFAAAEAIYCLSGQLWIPEAGGGQEK